MGITYLFANYFEHLLIGISFIFSESLFSRLYYTWFFLPRTKWKYLKYLHKVSTTMSRQWIQEVRCPHQIVATINLLLQSFLVKLLSTWTRYICISLFKRIHDFWLTNSQRWNHQLIQCLTKCVNDVILWCNMENYHTMTQYIHAMWEHEQKLKLCTANSKFEVAHIWRCRHWSRCENVNTMTRHVQALQEMKVQLLVFKVTQVPLVM